ncbi:MAG: hypothetical protein ACJ74T_06495 [Pyrinomonadaceae bacterium]
MKSNESSEKSSVLTGSEITGCYPEAIRSLLLPERRRFLASGLAGAAGLTLAPQLQRVLALPIEAPLWTPESLLTPGIRIRWKTIFTVVELVASLLGFRPFVMTVKELIDAFVPEKKEAEVAKQAQAQTQQAITAAGFPNQAGSAPADAPGKVGLYSVLAPDTGSLGLRSSLFQRVGYLRRAARALPRQFFYPALRNDGLNGITSHFDYDAGTYQAVGFLGGPTNFLLKAAEDWLRKQGYATQQSINEALYPYRQQNISYGDFNRSYSDPDFFKTRQKTATERAQLEVNYSFLRPGQGEGEVTFFRLENMISRKLMQTTRLRFGVGYERDESNQ